MKSKKGELELSAPAAGARRSAAAKPRVASGLKIDNGSSALLSAAGVFSSYLVQSPALCFIKDEAGRYIYVNDAVLVTFGLDPEQIVGKTDNDWLPADTAQEIVKADRLVLESGNPREAVETVPLLDGTERTWLSWKWSSMHPDGAKILCGIAFDITTRQAGESKLRGQTELLELILNNIGDPVIAVDEAGKLLLFNPAAIRLYGMGILGKPQSRMSERYGLFLPDGKTPYPNEQLPLNRAIRGEAVTDLEIFVRTPDAPMGAVLSAKAQPIFDADGKLKGGAAVFRDITARKRAEEELQLTVRRLEEARDEAIQASELKSQFVANISHELRTPMSGVLGMTELLMGMELNTEQTEIAGYIYESAQSLLGVLNELLDFSRLQAGKLDLERNGFTFRQIVDEVTQAVQLSLSRKQLEVKVDIDPQLPQTLIGDQRRIGQILLHLVQNSLKFTEQGNITISAAVERMVDTAAYIKISVSDTGIGIAEDALEHVFAPFVQADGSSTRKYGGVGLGLSIAKRLVKLMGGTMGVESQEGKGSTFWFTLPMECQKSCNQK